MMPVRHQSRVTIQLEFLKFDFDFESRAWCRQITYQCP